MSKSSKDDLGDRMKGYEKRETGRRLIPRLPICVRIDGKSFSKFTKGLTRPFDEGFSQAMIETTKHLVKQTNAVVGYTQSDEISLVIYSDKLDVQPYFDGKVFKLTSVLASMATAKFNNLKAALIPSKADKLAMFDARVFSVPSVVEATNLILWRWLDARKNSISMLAESEFSHNSLTGKSSSDKLEMLLQFRGVDWNHLKPHFKWGSFIRQMKVERVLTDAELDKIPEKYRPTSPVLRNTMEVLDLPPFIDIANRTELLFAGDDPVLITSEEVVVI